MSSLVSTNNLVAGTDLPKLKVQRYRRSACDLVHLRNQVRYIRFANDSQYTNRGVSIQVPQLEDAWLDTIMYIHQHGTCGKYAKDSYLGILYLYILYQQMRGTQATQLWRKRKELDPEFDLTPFEDPPATPGNYERNFLKWFIGVCGAAPIAVQWQLHFKLQPKSKLRPDDFVGPQVDKVMDELTEAFKKADINKMVKEEEILLKAMGDLDINGAEEKGAGGDTEMR